MKSVSTIPLMIQSRLEQLLEPRGFQRPSKSLAWESKGEDITHEITFWITTESRTMQASIEVYISAVSEKLGRAWQSWQEGKSDFGKVGLAGRLVDLVPSRDGVYALTPGHFESAAELVQAVVVDVRDTALPFFETFESADAILSSWLSGEHHFASTVGKEGQVIAACCALRSDRSTAMKYAERAVTRAVAELKSAIRPRDKSEASKALALAESWVSRLSS